MRQGCTNFRRLRNCRTGCPPPGHEEDHSPFDTLTISLSMNAIHAWNTEAFHRNLRECDNHPRVPLHQGVCATITLEEESSGKPSALQLLFGPSIQLLYLYPISTRCFNKLEEDLSFCLEPPLSPHPFASAHKLRAIQYGACRVAFS